MATEYVGPQDFLRDPLLPGVDQFGTWGHRGNLVVVSFFDRVTKNDSHELLLAEERSKDVAMSLSAAQPSVARVAKVSNTWTG
jgi:hypothetical protein